MLEAAPPFKSMQAAKTNVCNIIILLQGRGFIKKKKNIHTLTQWPTHNKQWSCHAYHSNPPLLDLIERVCVWLWGAAISAAYPLELW